MKNIKRLLVATFALISASGVATIVNPLVPVGEDAPFRVSVGAKGGLGGSPVDKGFGMSNLGGGISFAHNVGYDFEWGLGLAYDYTSYMGRIFSEASKPTQGNRIDAEIMFRYMPELAERFHLGLSLTVGWGRQFGKTAEQYNDARSFGDLNFKVGPALSYAFNDVVSLYFAGLFSMHNIGFGIKEDAKEYANLIGADLPLGFMFNISENTSLFVEANSRFTMFKKDHIGKGFKEELTLGINVAL